MNFALICPMGGDHTTPLRFQHHGHHAGNFVQHWLGVLGGDYWQGQVVPDDETLRRLDEYDVVMVNSNTNQYVLIVDLATRLKYAKTIMFQDGSAEDLNCIANEYRDGWIAAARACDMLMVYQPWAVDLFALWTDKPVRYVGFPCAPQVIAQHRKSFEQRRDIVAIGTALGLHHLSSNPAVMYYGRTRNGITSAAIAHKAAPEALVLGYYYDPTEAEFAAKHLPHCELRPHTSQPDYWEALSYAKAAINLDAMYTFGRFPIDCAALGIPCVGTPYNGTQAVLFPDLAVHPYAEVAEATALLGAVYADRAMWVAYTAYADVALAEFSDDMVRARFMAAVGEIGVA